VPDRLLLVDDEEPILFSMGEYFSSQGYAVDRARSCEEAQNLWSRRPDLAIVDLRLSGTRREDGLDVAQYVRDRDPEMPIILMTGFASQHAREEARRIGIGAFLSKPVPLSELGWVVRELLRQRQVVPVS